MEGEPREGGLFIVRGEGVSIAPGVDMHFSGV
jgi:hypothetical protein